MGSLTTGLKKFLQNKNKAQNNASFSKGKMLGYSSAIHPNSSRHLHLNLQSDSLVK